MGRTVPANSLMAMLAAETSETYIALLSITHDGGTFRASSDSVGHTYGGNPYVAFPFDIILPTNEQGKVVDMRVTLDNVDRQLIEAIRSQATPMAVELVIVAASDIATSTPTATFSDFTLRSVDYNAVQITGRITLEDFLSEPYPSGTFDQGHYPGLFVQGGTYDGEYDYEPPAPSGCTDFGEYILGAIPEGWVLTSAGGSFYTTFSEHDVGTDFESVGEADWDLAWGVSSTYPTQRSLTVKTGGSVGNLLAFKLTAASSSASYAWNVPGDFADGEILVHGLYTDTSTSAYGNGVFMRGVVDLGGNDLEMYSLHIDSNQDLRMFRNDQGGGSDVDLTPVTPKNLSLAQGDDYWMRFSCVGTAIKGKAWIGSLEDEPGSWDYDDVDSTYSGSGFMGVITANDGTYTTDYDQISVNAAAGTAEFSSGFSGVVEVVADTGQFSYTPQDTWLKMMGVSEIVWPGTDVDADVEVLVEFDYVAQDEYAPTILLRAKEGTDAVAYSKRFALMYKDVPLGTSLFQWHYRTADGAYTAIGTSLDKSLGSTGRTFIRASIEGSALKASIWQGTQSLEPSAWDIEETEVSISNAGVFGIWNQETTTQGISRIAHAFEGDSATFNCILDEVPSQAAYTDFAEYATGAPANPSNWTDEWTEDNFGDLDIVVDAAKVGGKFLRMNMTSSGRYGFWTWDDVGSVADVEILYKAKYFDTGNDQCNAVAFRVQGTHLNPGTSDIEWYQTGISNSGVPVVHFRSQNPSEAGNTIHGADAAALSISNGDEYWCRVRIVGTTLQAKWWVTSLDSEPEAWTYDFTETNISGAGRVGVVCKTGGTSGWLDDTDYDQIAVAIDGDTAFFPV